MSMIELFPLYGVTLGKTIFADIENIAGVNEAYKDARSKSLTINGVFFIEVAEENSIRYAGIRIGYHERNHIGFYKYINIPKKWRTALGLNWEMSYEECLSNLEDKGFSIESSEKHGSKITAITPNGSFILELEFWRNDLSLIMVSVNDCPHCKSKDIEIKTDDKTLHNYLICNECGHRWGTGYLEKETE